jgi:hypothetical protein
VKTQPVVVAAALIATAGLVAYAASPVPPSPPPLGATLQGEVLEVQNVSSYTYLRLRTKDGETWAAVPTTSIAKGARVTLADTSVMENFESRALNRKFDRIVFASLVNPVAGGATAAPPNPHGASPARASPVGKIAKASASDARTVAESVAGATALKGKTVTIRGQVVKYSAGILGKNWVHLQDGSGSPSAGTHDILVTTTDTAAVGDVVDARGTLRTDVDLGSGYKYAVLVEDAKIRR